MTTRASLSRVTYKLTFFTFTKGSIFAGHHFHVAHFARPARSAYALVHIHRLSARGTVHARFCRTPVDHSFAVGTRVTVRAVTGEVFHVVHTRGAVQTGRRIAFVYAHLTIAASKSATGGWKLRKLSRK